MGESRRSRLSGTPRIARREQRQSPSLQQAGASFRSQPPQESQVCVVTSPCHESKHRSLRRSSLFPDKLRAAPRIRCSFPTRLANSSAQVYERLRQSRPCHGARRDTHPSPTTLPPSHPHRQRLGERVHRLLVQAVEFEAGSREHDRPLVITSRAMRRHPFDQGINAEGRPNPVPLAFHPPRERLRKPGEYLGNTSRCCGSDTKAVSASRSSRQTR